MTLTIPSTDHISCTDLRQLQAEDPALRVFDVRTGAEFGAVHIPGSFNIPLDSLGEHAADLADLEHQVVLVCRSGSRAAQAHKQLTQVGGGRLHILEGGIEAWQASGGDVVVGTTDKWAMDRQVRFAAGSMALLAIILSIFVPKTKWLAGGVAGGLVFSAVTNTCAMANVLARLPYNRGDCDTDLEETLAAIRAD